MNDRCDHCGEPTLDTDTVCWHCGMPLPGRKELNTPKDLVKDDRQQSVSPSSVAMYTGMTIIVILGAWLVMVYLGRLPLVQVQFGTRTPAEWESIISAENSFILSLPESWWWIDGSSDEQRGAIKDLIAEEKTYDISTYPFGAEVADLEIQFIAETSSASGSQLLPFLVIARSSLLNRLTYEEAIDFLLNSEYKINEVKLVDDFDKSYLSIFVHTAIDEDLDMRCWQKFIRGETEAMLVSLCAPTSLYQANINTFEDILGSLQRLDS